MVNLTWTKLEFRKSILVYKMLIYLSNVSFSYITTWNLYSYIIWIQRIAEVIAKHHVNSIWKWCQVRCSVLYAFYVLYRYKLLKNNNLSFAQCYKLIYTYNLNIIQLFLWFPFQFLKKKIPIDNCKWLFKKIYPCFCIYYRSISFI